MNRWVSCLVTLLALAGRAAAADGDLAEVVAVEPAPGAPRVGPVRPAWCAGLPAEKARASWATRPMKQVVEGRSLWEQAPLIAFALCANPDDPRVKEQTGHFLQAWVNRQGVAAEALIPLLGALARSPNDNGERFHAAMDAACAKLPRPSPEASLRERVLAAVRDGMLGCNSEGWPLWVSGDMGPEMSWHYDARAEPPAELARVYLVITCLGVHGDLEEDEMAAWALCGADARGLDKARLEREIAGYPALLQAIARVIHARAQKDAAASAAYVEERMKAEPAWRAIVVDAPARAWKEWEERYARDRKVIEAARAYEELYDGPSKSAAQGCWPAAYAAFRGHLEGGKAATVPDALRLMTAPTATILLEQLVACASADDIETRVALRTLLSAARPVRGPRFAAYFAVLDAIETVRADRPRFPADPQWLAGRFTGRSPQLHGGGTALEGLDLADDDKGGVVKSVRRVDGGVVVEFVKERWQEDNVVCEDTSQIVMFRSDGTPIYRRKCKDLGKKWVEETHYPVWIRKELVAGIAPGAFLRAPGGGKRPGTDAHVAVPIEVWDGKARKQLRAVLGVPFAGGK